MFLLISATFVSIRSVRNVYPGFSIVNVTDLPRAAHNVRTHAVCCLRWLLMILSGLAEVLAANQLYSVATQSLFQVLCISKHPKGLPSILCCASPPPHCSCLVPSCTSLPDHLCCLAAKCSSHPLLLPVMCLLDACLNHVSSYLLLMFCLLSESVFVHLS